MSESTATAPESAPAVEPKAKKTAAKPKTKKNEKSKASRPRVVESDLTPSQRQTAVVKMMRKIGATSAATSVTATTLAAKCGMSRFEVYGALYHTHQLQAEGFVKQVKLEDNRENSYYLTAKGVKSMPAEQK